MLERVSEPRPSSTVPAAPATPATGIAELGPRVRPRLRPAAPADSPARGLVWKDVARVTAVALVLGFTQGARIAIAGGDTPALAALTAGAGSPAGTVELDAIRGPMWRPAGSIAERTATVMRPVLWQPAGSQVRLRGPVGERAIERKPARPPLAGR